MPQFGWTDEEVFRVAERAHSLYLQGAYASAGALFEGLVELDPGNRYCHNSLAAVYLALGKPQQAVGQATVLLARYPYDIAARACRCEAYVRMNRLEEAQKDFEVLYRTPKARAHARRLSLRIQACMAGFVDAS